MSIRTNLQNFLSILGCFQRNLEAECTLTTLSISYVLIGWYSRMRIPITHVFTKPVLRLPKQPSTCWRRTLHISVIRIPWYRIMQRLSHRRHFRNGASQEGLYIWQEPHITRQLTGQQKSWSRRTKDHWQSRKHSPEFLFSVSSCSTGEHRYFQSCRKFRIFW